MQHWPIVKKSGIIFVKFKFNWVSCIFIDQIWLWVRNSSLSRRSAELQWDEVGDHAMSVTSESTGWTFNRVTRTLNKYTGFCSLHGGPTWFGSREGQFNISSWVHEILRQETQYCQAPGNFTADGKWGLSVAAWSILYVALFAGPPVLLCFPP